MPQEVCLYEIRVLEITRDKQLPISWDKGHGYQILLAPMKIEVVNSVKSTIFKSLILSYFSLSLFVFHFCYES